MNGGTQNTSYSQDAPPQVFYRVWRDGRLQAIVTRRNRRGDIATPVRIELAVGEDGAIQIRAPELVPGQRALVTVETTEKEETTEEAPAEKWHVIDIIADLPGHRLFKTAEEVDACIREERDSWDR
jgi:hypothetical protein